MNNAVGFQPQQSLLSGLSFKGNVGAYSKGRAYQSGAEQQLAASKTNQQAGVQQMEQQSALRQQEAQNTSQRSLLGAEQKLAGQQAQSRNSVFNTGMQYDYAQLNKQRHMQLLNSLISSAAREF